METTAPTEPPRPKLPPAPTAPTHPPAAAAHHEDEIPTDLHRPHWITIAIVALLFAGLLVGLYFLGLKPHEAEQQQAKADADEQATFVASVNVAAPKPDVARRSITLPCDIRPNQETLIYPRASGYLKKFNKDIGDHVSANEVLAEIDAPEVDAQLAQSKAAQTQAEAAVNKAQADLDLAQRTVDRYHDVHGNAVTQQEFDQISSERDQAKAALSEAQANVKAAASNVDRLAVLQSFDVITAPYDGIITERNYDVGVLLSGGGQGRALFRLTQTSTLRVFVNVPQVESSLITLNGPAKLTVRNYPGRQFDGTVARRAGELDASTRTMPFEIDFPNPKGELYAGMYGEIHLDVVQNNPVLMVPTSALVFNAAGVQIAVVRDGKVHFQQVSVGDDRGTELEITQGLSPDDRVITNVGERLVEGTVVHAIDTTQRTAAADAPARAQAAPVKQ